MSGWEKDIGHMLYLARQFQGLTADEVAKRCNVTRGLVYKWESQRYVLPKNLPTLAKALDVPLSLLIAENGPRPRLKKRS